MLFGGLHIEMAALKTLGDWLKGSGWVQALVQADIITVGTADSCLRALHVARTRRAHQVTAAALYILQRRAYEHYRVTGDEAPLEFKQWQDQRQESSPQCQYWATGMAMELSLLAYVRSLREANFSSYLDALTELISCIFCSCPYTLCSLDTSSSQRYGCTSN